MNRLFKFSLQTRQSFIALSSIVSIILFTQSGFAAPVHAFFADEHNTTPSTPTGNRLLEIDLDSMQLVNTLDLPGLANHHADNGFNSKLYTVPKGSSYVNAVEVRKDHNGTTSMLVSKKIDLIHMPRSGDAYNKKFNVILMVARNRPMGSFIDVETDKVVGTIGKNVNCQLTDGTMLLSHADANTIAGATKYQCVNSDHGGDQISGHPYWLTADYAAIVDRSNRQISVYKVWKEGSKLKSSLVNHLQTRTSVHQIVPRDRTALPGSQKADFYAIEEGNIGNASNYGIPEALIKMKLTTNGLQLVKRMDLQRAQATSRAKSDRILQACKDIYFKDRSVLYPPSMWFGDKGITTFNKRRKAFQDLFALEGINYSTETQSPYNDFPIECLHTGIPGGHNADFAPDNKHLFIGMAGGMMSVIDIDRMFLVNNVDAGAKSGPGHTCFSKKHNVAIVSNHKATHHRIIAYYDRAGIQGRPTDGGRITLEDFGILSEGITDTKQSHSCYVDEEGDFYYNFFTDGGVFYKIDLKKVADWSYGKSRDRDFVVNSTYTGGIPIQGSYIPLSKFKDHNPNIPFKLTNDFITSDGSPTEVDVLANDTGSNLVLRIVDTASNGTVKIVNGKALYTPNQGFSGTDEFWYGVSSYPAYDPWEWALVTIEVNSSTQPTVLKAVNDNATVTSGNTVTIDVLKNDTGKNITLGIVDSVWTGTLTKSANKITYEASSDFEGEVDFWYSVNDDAGNEEWAKVTVTVTKGSSLGFFANNDTATVSKGQSVLIDVLANDTGNNISLSIVDSAWIGTTTKVGNKIKYQAENGFVGEVEAWYAITDANGDEKWALVTITITQ